MPTSRDLAKLISKIKPGECCRISRSVLQAIPVGVLENNYGFPIQDWILEHIPGSSFEFGYNEDLATGDITYFRLPQPLVDGRRTYVSPDRRDRYRKRFDRIYEPISCEE